MWPLIFSRAKYSDYKCSCKQWAEILVPMVSESGANACYVCVQR